MRTKTDRFRAQALRGRQLRLVRRRLTQGIAVRTRLIRQARLIVQIADIIVTALRNGHRLILFGNGGSAADAQHIAAELVGRFYSNRPGLPALALGTNVCSLTAISNDFSFARVLAHELQALGQPGDIAFGLSTSGNSANVLRALAVARRQGLITVGFTGRTGGKIRSAVDYCLCVPSSDTPRIQECHIAAGHIICELVEQELLPEL